jgi:hypothetical protein
MKMITLYKIKTHTMIGLALYEMSLAGGSAIFLKKSHKLASVTKFS